MRKIIVCFLAAVLSYASYGRQAPAPRATITVNTSGSGSTIPSNFIGLSGEVGDFVNGLYQGTSGVWTSVGGTAQSWISIINLLGSNGVYRLGGSSSDAATAPNITSGMANNLAAFLTALGNGWTLIYGLDFIANDAATATTTASRISTAVGVNNVVFQFGNEPSLNGVSAATYTTRWNAYYTAVSGSVSPLKVSAVDDIINTGWGNPITEIGTLTPGLAGMSFVSQHWYAFCKNTWSGSNWAALLQSIYTNTNSATSAGPGWLGGANQGGGYLFYQGSNQAIPLRISESNTICLQGQTGMSDRMMSATWYLDFMIMLASQGWSGHNLHSGWIGGASIYNIASPAADQNFVPNPVFYGPYLFSKVVGQQILPSSIGTNANVAALATKGVNGNANIVVTNNDGYNTVTVTPQQSGVWTTASVLQIKSATGLGCADASVTVGGQAFGESGAWSGAPFFINNGQSIALGPCEAALIQIQP